MVAHMSAFVLEVSTSKIKCVNGKGCNKHHNYGHVNNMYFTSQSVLIANVHTCTLQEQYVFIHKALADYMMEKAK